MSQSKRFVLPENWNEGLDVLVVGCGGTGSEIVDALCRLDLVLRKIGHPGMQITLMDADTVSPANVGRQRFVSADVGKNKAEVLARRYGLLLNVDMRFRAEFLKPKSRTAWRYHQLVITAVDRASVRTQLADTWRNEGLAPLWLDCGNGAHTGQVVLGHLAGKRPGRLPHVLDLFPKIRDTPDDDEPSCSVAAAIRSQNLGVNRFMADTAVFTILAQLFTKGYIEHHGALIDMAKPMVSPIKIDPQAWAFFGYTAPAEVSPAKGKRKKETVHG